MHAGRVSSLKRNNSLEQRRRRLSAHRTLTNGDLSSREDEEVAGNAPWYVTKWDERRSAFASAKSAQGISWFHMFAIIALLGVGLMVGSLFVGPAAGLLEIGVSAFLFSILCLIFVRCDTEAEHKLDDKVGDDAALSDIVIETQLGEKDVDHDMNEASDQIRALLMRSNPRKIPSPLRVFGYEMNFSPIQECSEPSSNASSFLTRYNCSFPSRLATSSTGDSLSRVSSKASCGGGGVGGVGEVGSPINEELENFDYDQPLQLNIDHNINAAMQANPYIDWTSAEEPQVQPEPEDQTHPHDLSPDLDLSPEQEPSSNLGDTDLLLLSNSNLSLCSNNTASFDADDSITADLSVVTVMERKGSTNSVSPNSSSASSGNSSGSGVIK